MTWRFPIPSPKKWGKDERLCKIGNSPTKVKFLSDKTAHDRHYCTACLLEPMSGSDDDASDGENHQCGVDDDGACDDVGHFALGWGGGSYRTVQRWFNTVLPWAQMSWLIFQTGATKKKATTKQGSRMASGRRDVPKAAGTKTSVKWSGTANCT